MQLRVFVKTHELHLNIISNYIIFDYFCQPVKLKAVLLMYNSLFVGKS